MNPYVYKKHHQPYQLLAIVYLFCIMILNLPLKSQGTPCNYPVKKVKIHSEGAKGFLRVNGSRIVANGCDSCLDSEKFYLYTVTIEQHKMLLYHIRSGKFICWNKSFKKLVTRKNPVNLTYCTFEEKVSIRNKAVMVRYTSMDHKQKEVEIRFLRSGALAKPRLVEKCLERKMKKGKLEWPMEELMNLDLAHIEDNLRNTDKYKKLTNCANPDFLKSDVECDSGMPDFCNRMRRLRQNGHSISPEIIELCKNKW